jgi:hypothetical protein
MTAVSLVRLRVKKSANGYERRSSAAGQVQLQVAGVTGDGGKGGFMPIWELKPTDKESAQWRASRYTDKIIVRAASPDKAREFATSRLHKMSKPISGADTPHSPWNQPDLVACRLLKDSRYDEDGPDEILEPKELNDI